ncbi:MAG TPA: branched-chain amino acid ABC transporter permease [Anaerolineae bacterium]|jgi:branched-chain amino acid transport system permease protein|nr:branched-chain amino acid ABC transporter permease [Anaerolineae bacterium]
MNRLRSIPGDYIAVAIFLVALSFLPLILDRFLLSLALLILFWAYLGNAWNIMGGYTGLFSFGHAMFYGIGAYTSTVLLIDYAISPIVGMLVGALIAGLFGAFVGYLLSRFGVRGHFFALGTFAIAEMVRLLATEMEFINTSIGIHIPLVRGDSLIRLQFEETFSNYFYVILILFVVGQLVTITIVRNKLGYYFQAIREDEEAAAALGVNVLRYKVISVAISAALTAIGGSFFAQYFLFIDPTIVFGVSVSVQILLRPIVGGVGTIWGPFVGALLLTPLAEFTRSVVRNPPSFLDFIEGRAGVDVMLFGAILIIVVLFMPDGLIGAGKRLLNRVRKRKNEPVTQT